VPLARPVRRVDCWSDGPSSKMVIDRNRIKIEAADSCRTILMNKLDKITLTFQGSALDNLAVHVEGPDDLRARIEVALLNR
jgi:hypothetical protein